MAVYFSIILDISPENFDYTVHQANRGTSGFLFCKTNKQDDVLEYKKTLQIITKDEVSYEDRPEENESNLETSDEGQEDEENIEKLVVVADKDSDTESVTTTSLALKDIRSKIEDLCPHIQIQKV